MAPQPTAQPQPLPPLPSTEKKSCLLVFIHGFLGSEESFEQLPIDLLHVLATHYNIPKSSIETRVFPRYDTKGNNARAAQKLIDWLLLHATTARYKCVILLAHSMGGLLAADAYQYLYDLHRKGDAQKKGDEKGKAVVKETDGGGGTAANGWFATVTTTLMTSFRTGKSTVLIEPANPATTPTEGLPAGDAASTSDAAGASSGPAEPSPSASQPADLGPAVTPGDPTKTGQLSDAEWERSEVLDDEIDSDTRFLVNIRGIITFDSPFYGLHPGVITQAGTTKALSIVSEGISNATTYIPMALEAVQSSYSSYLPRTVAVPTGVANVRVPVRTSWLLKGAATAMRRGNAGSLETIKADADVVSEAVERMSLDEEQVVSVSTEWEGIVKDQSPETISDGVDGRSDTAVAVDVMITDATGPSISGSTGNLNPSPVIVVEGSSSEASTLVTETVSTAVTVQSGSSGTSTLFDPSSWPSWARYAATGAAVAAGAYTLVGVAPLAVTLLPVTAVARAVTVNATMAQVEYLRDHLEFLYPLVNSHQEMDRRVLTLQREMERRKRLTFKGFYLALPSADSKTATSKPKRSQNPPQTGKGQTQANAVRPSTPNTPPTTSQNPSNAASEPGSAADPTVTSDSLPPASPIDCDPPASLSDGEPFLPDDATLLLDKTPPLRHFCVPPPSSTAHLFSQISSPYTNEIDAHMNLFLSTGDGTDYNDLIHRTAQIVAEVLEREERRVKSG
ncbi:hypothetical protein HK104_001811 [Borealophlyctis nickersoniae]|nr:hypothetical protein HK104_001811 [Borealophlyctis nickersoniae]